MSIPSLRVDSLVQDIGTERFGIVDWISPDGSVVHVTFHKATMFEYRSPNDLMVYGYNRRKRNPELLADVLQLLRNGSSINAEQYAILERNLRK